MVAAAMHTSIASLATFTTHTASPRREERAQNRKKHPPYDAIRPGITIKYRSQCPCLLEIIFLNQTILTLISPTHKRTEGRAPRGALSLLQKDAALQGGSSRNRCRLNVKMCVLRGDCVFFYCFSSPNPFSNLFNPSRTILNLRPKNLSEI